MSSKEVVVERESTLGGTSQSFALRFSSRPEEMTGIELVRVCNTAGGTENGAEVAQVLSRMESASLGSEYWSFLLATSLSLGKFVERVRALTCRIGRLTDFCGRKGDEARELGRLLKGEANPDLELRPIFSLKLRELLRDIIRRAIGIGDSRSETGCCISDMLAELVAGVSNRESYMS